MKRLNKPLAWIITAAAVVFATRSLLPARADTGSGDESALQDQSLPRLTASDLAILKQLETGDWHQRKAAAAAAASIRPLPDDTDLVIRAMLARTTSPEAQTQLDAVLKQLAQTHLGGATPITLHLKQVAAKEACEKLFAQIHWKIVTEPANLLDDPKLPRVSIDADAKPFWDVMYQLSEQTKLGLTHLGRSELRLIGNEPLPDGPQCAAGPIDFFATLLIHNELLSLGAHVTDGDDLWMDIVAYEEPKLMFLGIDPYVQVQEATDDHGNSLLYQGYRTALSIKRGPPWMLRAMLSFPKNNPGKVIKTFRALAHFRVGVNAQHIEIDDPLHAAAREITIGKTKVQFLGCKAEDNQIVVSFSSPANDNDPEWDQTMKQLVSRGQIQDSDGRPLARSEFGIKSYQPERVEYFKCRIGRAFEGGVAGAPARLVWEVCPATRLLSIPIEFHDIDMDVFPHGEK